MYRRLLKQVLIVCLALIGQIYGKEVLDLEYNPEQKGKSGQTTLDLYIPDEANKLPIVVFLHGGGWTVGDKSHVHSKPDFFNRNGYLFASVNYRLNPEGKFPVQAFDVAAALAWIWTNIGKYGGDRERLFVMGHSAGAHLAAIVSTDERFLKQAGGSLGILKGTILLDGAGYDIPWQLQNGNSRSKAIYIQAFGEEEEFQRNASPIAHVAAGKGIPPFLIVPVATRDISLLQSQRFARALEQAGVPTRIVPAHGKTHQSLNVGIGTPKDSPTEAILEFLKMNVTNGD